MTRAPSPELLSRHHPAEHTFDGAERGGFVASSASRSKRENLSGSRTSFDVSVAEVARSIRDPMPVVRKGDAAMSALGAVVTHSDVARYVASLRRDTEAPPPRGALDTERAASDETADESTTAAGGRGA